MSEQYDDLVQAIRKIARTDPEIQTALGPAKQKASIPAVRGIAYRNLDSGISSGQGELPDDANTEQNEEDKKQGQPTLKSDADNAPAINDDLQPGDQADKFKAYDCTTGDEIALDLSPIPGQEYPAPDGWESANVPPVDPTYEEGYFWASSTNVGASRFVSKASAKAALFPAREEYYVSPAQAPYVEWLGAWSLHASYGSKSEWGIFYPAGEVWRRYYKDIRYTPPVGTGYADASIWKGACAGGGEGYCNPAPEDLLLETSWPSNSKTELALINGQFTASQYDPDAAQAYKDNPPSQLEVCDGNGNRYQVSAAINNSTMLTKLNVDSSVPDDGESVLIDQSGTVTNRVANLFRNNYLPQ